MYPGSLTVRQWKFEWDWKTIRLLTFWAEKVSGFRGFCLLFNFGSEKKHFTNLDFKITKGEP